MKHWPAWVARLQCCHDVGCRPDVHPAPDAGELLNCGACGRQSRVVDVIVNVDERDAAGRR